MKLLGHFIRNRGTMSGTNKKRAVKILIFTTQPETTLFLEHPEDRAMAMRWKALAIWLVLIGAVSPLEAAPLPGKRARESAFRANHAEEEVHF